MEAVMVALQALRCAAIEVDDTPIALDDEVVKQKHVNIGPAMRCVSCDCNRELVI